MNGVPKGQRMAADSKLPAVEGDGAVETPIAENGAARVSDPELVAMIRTLVSKAGGKPDSFEGRMIVELVQTSLKLTQTGYDSGQLKLLNRAMKEMRYAYRVFNRYRATKKISIFGSARTPADAPDYHAAREFSAAIARHGWMVITGAGDGIMKAGHEGPEREASFGLSIRLPFETTANTVIEGDPKLINFRYFFTRKLMFISHAHAVAVFPGGFGTHDELFEALTLVQTGKSNLFPIVLIEHPAGDYWKYWEQYIKNHLLGDKYISPEDLGIYHITTDVQDAVEYVVSFYRLYHSSRYVGDTFVVRLNRALKDEELANLNDEFAVLLKSGRIEQTTALPGESDHLELPRLAFHHTRRNFAMLLAMVRRINSFAAAGA